MRIWDIGIAMIAIMMLVKDDMAKWVSSTCLIGSILKDSYGCNSVLMTD